MTTASGVVPNYKDWLGYMQSYQAGEGPFEGVAKYFWLVMALPGNDYSDKLEWHETIPMFVPTSGTGKLLGIAGSRAEMEELIAGDQKNVHLVYKGKLQGEKAWRALLEFLGTHAMLEKE